MKKSLLALLLALPIALKADTSLVFNEIMYHPATNEPALEWIEFHNQMAVDIDVSEWTITGGIDYTFPTGTIIEGGAYVVVAIDPPAFLAHSGVQAMGPFTGRLSNNGETLRLRNINRRVVDLISYGVEGAWPVGPDGSGVSLSKFNRDTASGPAANWVSSDVMGGSPGASNFPTEDELPPTTQLITLESEWRYEDSGVELAPQWRDNGFNDSSWTSDSTLLRNFVPPPQSGPIPTLFSTGLDDERNPVVDGAPDPHYRITQAAQGAINRQAIVIANHPVWLANNSVSKFIGIQNPGAANVAPGAYTYETTFSLANADLNTAEISFRVAIDNQTLNVSFNGVNTGFSHNSFTAWSPFRTITSGFNPGINTLTFQVNNDPPGNNPHGFRVEVNSTATFTFTNTPLATVNTHYLRKSFNFSGDPLNTELKLNTIFDDGAVFYLNGVEVSRHNMPAGPVAFSTAASSDVTSPSFTGFITIPASSLVQGQNVLAVEVHQSAGDDDMIFDAELTSTPLPPQGTTLGLNEVSGSTNTPFQVEVHNYGSNPIDLDGFVLRKDGVTDEEFVFPAGPPLDGGGYAFIIPTFQPVSGDKLLLMTPTRSQVLDGRVVKSGPRARIPAGTGPWHRPDQATFGGPNSFSFHDEIVINEIMYHHQRHPSTNGLPPKASDEAWIELYNRGTSTVDLTGWRFTRGINYTFPPGTTIAPGAYLVVAEDAAELSATYPGIDIIGDFGGNLSHKQDRLTLEDPHGNPADEVHYYDDGRWSKFADGGGSSLELRNPNADNSRGEAWGPSDETGKSSWRNYSYRMAAATVEAQPSSWRDIVLGLLGRGECLIDDLSIIESPDTAPFQFVGNGNFESGMNGWRVPGNHGYSRVIPDPDNQDNNVLHIVASGPQEHMHNHIESTILGGRSPVNGREYEVSFRAKWLKGSRFLNTRLYFNRVARSTELEIPMLNGTPGAQNSIFEPNVGPTFDDLQHSPAVPQPNETVTVSVTTEDPNGVANANLFFSANGAAFSSVPMTHQGGGRYTGSISGRSAGTIVQFYIQATDSLGASSTFPAAGPDSGALYEVDNNEANFDQGHNLRLILSPSNRSLFHADTNVMSNARLPATLIYNEKRVYHNLSVRLKGSERGRNSSVRASFNIKFNPDDLFRGVHPVMLVDRSGAGGATANKQEEIYIRHMLLRAGGIMGPRPDLCRIIAPQDANTSSAILSPRHEDEYIETEFANGNDGDIYELELIYSPNNANANGYKIPQPDSVVEQDYTDLGDDKEHYRYHFIRKTNRDNDDYSRFIEFAKGFALTGDELENYVNHTMDVDQWMRAWAFLNLCGVGDMYNYGFDHNFMTYLRPSDQKMLAVPWDMDFSFFRGAGSNLEGDDNVQKIINRPAHFRIFAAHLLDIMDTIYNTAYMGRWISHYAQFYSQDQGRVTSYINSRNSNVRSQLDSRGNNVAFNVTSANTINTSSNVVVITGTAPFAAYTIRANGVAYPIVWNYNNLTPTDSAARTQWQMRVPVTEASQDIQITGYDLHGNELTNLSETVTVNYSGSPALPENHVAINEIMYHPAIPGAALLELYNTSSDYAFDLSGYRINGIDYDFPTGAVILPNDFYVVAENMPSYLDAYGSGRMPDDVYDGNLDRGGETLTLFRPGPTPVDPEEVIDRVRYDDLTPWPATPDGTGPSLQLIDATKDNSRVSNWSDGAGWQFFSFTGTIGSTTMFLFMSDASTLFIDNITVVTGTVAEAGANVIANGDFETGLSPWTASGSHSTSDVSTEQAFAGNSSLKIVATGPGSGGAAVRLTGVPVDRFGTYTMSFWFLPTETEAYLTARFGSAFRPELFVKPQPASPGAPNSAAAVIAPFPQLWLNEIQPNNTVGIMDNAGDVDPLLELYNAGPSTIDLTDYYLSDDYGNLNQWQFPPGSMIDPGEFKVIFIDGEPGETTGTEFHTSFNISSPTGAVALAHSPGGASRLIDYLNYPNVGPALSYGDFPDGQPFNRQIIFTTTPGAPNVAQDVTLFINEWLAQNNTINADPADGDFNDWFEIYNPSTNDVDISGFYLTDDFLNKTKFRIPLGYVVPAGGFLLVWADEESGQNNSNRLDLHVNFRLAAIGEQIGLYTPELQTVDEVTWTNQVADVSRGRFPDATPNFFDMPGPTPRNFNSLGGGNTAPTLDPIANSNIAQGTTLSFTANATDPEVPPQTLTFSLDPGAPAGADINPSTGEFTWTPTPGQSPSTNSITVRVTDDGAPPRDASHTFEVIVFNAPEVTITSGGGNVSLTFPTTPGKTYRVEFTDSLTTINWQPLGADQVAAGNELTIVDPIGLNTQRYYRFLQLD